MTEISVQHNSLIAGMDSSGKSQAAKINADGSLAVGSANPINQVVFTGSVSWTLDENAVKTLTIPIPTNGIPGQQFLVSIRNGSSVVDLAVSVSNIVVFGGMSYGAEIIPATDISVPATKTIGKIVTGFPLGTMGMLTFTKSAATAAAFTAYVEIRRA